MPAAEVSLSTGNKKLTSFSLSDKDTKSDILENAMDREYLDYFKASDKVLQYLVEETEICRLQM